MPTFNPIKITYSFQLQLISIPIFKSVNLQYNTLGRWDKRLIDQAFDVPSIIFFIIFYRLRALKTLYFYFCKVIKK